MPDLPLTVPEFLAVRSEVAAALKAASPKSTADRDKIAEYLMKIGYINIPEVLRHVTPPDTVGLSENGDSE